jgi:hypothetical protein
MPEHEALRQREFAAIEVQVAPADAHVAHAHEHFARAGGNVIDLREFDVTRSREQGGLHAPILLAMTSGGATMPRRRGVIMGE